MQDLAFHFADSVRQDLLFAVNSFRKTPLFSIAALLTLALGIGANTVIFSVTDASILHPLALRNIPEPDRLVMLWERSPMMSAFLADRLPARSKDIRIWQARAHSFSDVAWWRDVTMTARTPDGSQRRSQRLEVGQTSADVLPLLGTHAAVGRDLQPGDMEPGRNRVALLSHPYALEHFGQPRQALGQSILLDGSAYSVIGVLPAGSQLPAMWGGFDQKKIGVFIPALRTPPADVDKQINCYVYGRLRPSVTLPAARAEMNGIQQQLAKTDNDLAFFSGINVSPLAEEDVGADSRQALWTLQAAVGLILLIACANVANLMLARAVSREREMAIRMALGAGALRLLRMMLTESLLLSTTAALCGTALSYFGLRLVSTIAPEDTHGLHEMRLDAPVLAFTCGVTLLAALLFGLAPYFMARRATVSAVLASGSRSVTGSSGRLRAALIIGELALSTVLLVSAGLMIRTLNHLLTTNLGFQRDHLLSLHLQLSPDRFPDRSLDAANTQILALIRAQPFTRSAMLTSAIPMQSVSENSFEIDGHPQDPKHAHTANTGVVSDRYFETLRIPLLAGRTFVASDTKAGVAVVNRAFARKVWGKLDILGHVIDFSDRHFRIIGIVADEHQLGPDRQASPEFYLPGFGLREEYLILRTTSNPASLGNTVQNLLARISPDISIGEIRTVEQTLDSWVAPRRFVMNVLLSFAVLALLLASVGLYGVLAYSVTMQTRDIGIRVALGAEPKRIAASVLRNALRYTAIGIVLGAAGSFALSIFLASQLVGVESSDPVTLASVVTLLLAVSLIASYLPARRAARVDPVVALRAE